MKYKIYRFHPDEVLAYRAIRLEALRSEPAYFGNSYDSEVQYSLEYWRKRLESPLRATFGIYAEEDLIGVTCIFYTVDKPDEGQLTQSYIQRSHRGKGLSAMLYDARIAWAKETGLRYLIVGHRASNLISKAANQRYGFLYSHSESCQWPDGSEDEMLYYKLVLDIIPKEKS